MKKLFLSVVLLSVSIVTFAQDVITTKDGDEIYAKVIKIGESEIEYKKWSNLEGPVYTLKTNNIFMVKYENGEKDVFKLSPTEDVKEPQNTIESDTPIVLENNHAETNNSEQNIFRTDDLLSYKKHNKVFCHGEKLKQREVKAIINTNPEAYYLYTTGRTKRLAGEILCWTGIAALGGSIGLIFAAGDGSFIILDAVGTALIVTSIPFLASGKARIVNSYKMYNDGIVRKKNSAYLGFGITQKGGLAVTLNF